MNIENEKKAIERLKAFEPESEPYFLCYSGGKDSDCIRILASLAGVKHDIVHNLTTVDAPETIKYIKSIPNVIIKSPKRTMWKLIVDKKNPPTRFSRYCCQELKEHGGKGRFKITGVRWAESNKRMANNDVIKIIGKPKTTQKLADEMGIDYSISNQGGLILNNDNHKSRRFVENCYRTTSTMINPIVDWSDSDVWQFLKHYGCKSNPLYYSGCKRVGCIGCPMSHNQLSELNRYPIYKQNYIKAFGRMIKARIETGLPVDERWKDGESVMKWWTGEFYDPYQLSLL